MIYIDVYLECLDAGSVRVCRLPYEDAPLQQDSELAQENALPSVPLSQLPQSGGS